MSDELKEHNILKSILIVRFACAKLDVGQLIHKLAAQMISHAKIDFLGSGTGTSVKIRASVCLHFFGLLLQLFIASATF
jgi:hypothetical protein